jgi:hypothetical protein
LILPGDWPNDGGVSKPFYGKARCRGQLPCRDGDVDRLGQCDRERQVEWLRVWAVIVLRLSEAMKEAAE